MKKAYVVSDDENTVISFHHHRITAFIMGIRALHGDEGELSHYQCRRAKQYDEYATADKVPAHALIADGWWMECVNCGCRMDYDSLEEEGQDPYDVQGTFGHAFCSTACTQSDEMWQFNKNKARHKALASAHGTLRAQLSPKQRSDIEFLEPNVFSVEVKRLDDDTPRVGQTSIHFKFPGQKWGSVEFVVDKSETKFYIPRGDVEAYKNWKKETTQC